MRLEVLEAFFHFHLHPGRVKARSDPDTACCPQGHLLCHEALGSRGAKIHAENSHQFGKASEFLWVFLNFMVEMY